MARGNLTRREITRLIGLVIEEAKREGYGNDPHHQYRPDNRDQWSPKLKRLSTMVQKLWDMRGQMDAQRGAEALKERNEHNG